MPVRNAPKGYVWRCSKGHERKRVKVTQFGAACPVCGGGMTYKPKKKT